MNTLILIIWFLVLLTLTFTYYNYRKRRGMLFLFILSIYTFSAFGSILYTQTSYFRLFRILEYDLSVFPFLYWGLAFYIICIPIIYYDKNKYKQITFNPLLVRTICILSLVLSILPLLEMLPHLSDILNSSNFASDIQDIHRDDEKRLPITGVGMFCYRIVKRMRFLTMICIIPVMLSKKKDVLSICGITLSIIVTNLASFMMASRGTLLTTIINFLLIFILLIPFITAEQRKKIVLGFSFIMGLVVIAFVAITIGRGIVKQEDTESFSLYTFTIRYIGEGFLYFDQYIDKIKGYTDGDYCFYVFKSLLGYNVPEISGDYFRLKLEPTLGIPTLNFYTFIGFFVMDIGFIGTLICFSIVSIVMKMSINLKTSRLPFSTLFIFFFFTSTVANGACLYQHAWNNSMNILIAIIIYFVIRTTEHKHKVYEKVF